MLFKSIKLVLLLLSLLFLRIRVAGVNFCKKDATCGSTYHTICNVKHDCSISDNCQQNVEALLSDSDRTQLVDAHNKLRSLVATGKAAPGLGGKQLPSASDMKEMVWDNELEFIAQCWANQCALGHDQCRGKSDGTYAGQNIIWGPGTDLEGMINSFYSEIQYTSESDITEFHGASGHPIGHFTQLAYYNSSQLGCGRVRYCVRKFKMASYALVCNYAEGGNVLGGKIYTKGDPCGSCPGNCHSTYPGLCKTPPSTTPIPDICSHSRKWSCKPILTPSAGFRNYFEAMLLTNVVASYLAMVAFS